MAKMWYPVVDYVKCDECGSCISKCSHGVYDENKGTIPVVINPVECVDHCHGCGTICPTGAITYIGEDTDWIPPNADSNSHNGCGCADGNCDSGCSCC